MTILVTGVEPPVPEIVERLAMAHDVRHTPLLPADSAELPALVAGCEAIVHGGTFVPGLGEQEALDLASRRTYDLCQAAEEARVGRVVVLSTLDLFRHYPEDLRVGEQFEPRPPAELRPLCRYLGELVCREFARTQALQVLCLRLGTVVREEAVAGRPLDPAWLDPRDAAAAVETALTVGEERRFRGYWRVVHLVGRFPNPRFSPQRAEHALNFVPRHSFGVKWEERA